MGKQRPKDIGTQAESACVRAATSYGFLLAERRSLAGINDRGDILLAPGAIMEVKGGDAAKTATPYRIEQWIAETEREIDNNDQHVDLEQPTVGFLAVQRRGIGLANALDWDAYIPQRMLYRIIGVWEMSDRYPLHYLMGCQFRLSVRDALHILRLAGWGEPI